MENVDYTVLVSRWIHIVGAVITIGGSMFMMFALLPGMKATLDETTRNELREAVRKRWSMYVHIGITLLLITGGINFFKISLATDMSPMPYHAIFGVKFLAALSLFFVGTAMMGKSPAFEKIRQNPSKWLRYMIGVGSLVILLSGVLAQVREHQPPRLSDQPVAMHETTTP